MSNRTIDDILLDDSDDDDNDNGGGVSVSAFLSNKGSSGGSGIGINILAGSVDLETLLLEDDDDDDDDDTNSRDHRIHSIKAPSINSISISNSNSTNNTSDTTRDTNSDYKLSNNSNKSNSDMISLLNTLQGFDEKNKEINNNNNDNNDNNNNDNDNNNNDNDDDNNDNDDNNDDITNKNDSISANNIRSYHSTSNVSRSGGDTADADADDDDDDSPVSSSSSSWDPSVSTKQKLTALMAADRREQRQLLAGSKEIVSALHLNYSKGRKMPSDGSSSSSSSSVESRYNNVKCIELETLSSQLMRNASYKQHGPGIATVVCTPSKFIAIGTSKGLILLFDYNQEIRQVIGSTVAHTSRSIAPVTCLSINNTGTTLVCGYESGEVALWDIAKGSVLKRVTDLHTTKIIRINFVRHVSDGLPNMSSSGSDFHVISADDKGVVRTIHFSKVLWSSYMSDSECLLDSSSGAILDMVPLLPLFDAVEAETDAYASRIAHATSSVSAQKFQENILSEMAEVAHSNIFISSPSQQFVAFNSVLRTYIVQVQPIVRIIHKWAAPDSVCDPVTHGINPECIACIDWYWNMPRQENPAADKTVARDTTSTGSFNPLIARSWGGHVEVYSMWASARTNAGDIFTFKLHKDLSFKNCNIVGLKWIARSRLVLLTVTDIMVLSSTLELMERTSLTTKLQVSLRSSLDERTSLSQPIPSIFSAYAQRFYILTPESLCSFHMQSWVEIADQLIRGGKWLEALALVVECVAGKGSDALTDEVHIERFIKSYVDLAVTQSTSINQGTQARNHYHLVAGVCIEYCALTSRFSLLFGPLYDAFNRTRQHLIFLDSLEPYILSKNITSLPPHILSDMLDAAANAHQRLASLDRVIAYLDVNHIDLDSVGRFLLHHNMFSSFLYVYSNGVHDYGGAFHIIFDRMLLFQAEATCTQGDSFPTPLQADTGYKLLLFLQYTAEDKVFPRGDDLPVPSKWLSELMEAVLSDSYCSAPYSKTESLNAVSDTRSPYLYYLAKVDSPATVHCVASGLKKLYEANKSEPVPCKAFVTLIDMFTRLFEFTDSFNTDPAAHDQIRQIYFDNVIEILVLDPAPLPTRLVLAMIKYCYENIQPQSQAENLLVSMVYNQSRHGNGVVEGRIREELESHNFWRAALNIQGAARTVGRSINVKDFERAIRSYMKRQETDLSSSSNQVFTFIQAQFDMLLQDNSSASVTRDLCQSLCRKIVDLMDISQEQTKLLVCSTLHDHVSDLIEQTRKHPYVQFELLKSLVLSISGDADKELSSFFTPVDLLVYVKLMITYAPNDLYVFIKSNDSYPLDECLVLCREHSVADATSWLLEKTGETTSALNMLLAELLKNIQSAKRSIDMHLKEESVSMEKTIILQVLNKLGSSRIEAATHLKCYADLSHHLDCCIGLCSRNSSKTDPTLWFTTFEFLLKERQNIRRGGISSASEVVYAMIGQLIQTFMVHMRTCVPPKEIILTVTQAHATGTRYEEFKDVMTSMIDSYSWETLVQETLVSMHLSDLFTLHMKKYAKIKTSVRYESSFELTSMYREEKRCSSNRSKLPQGQRSKGISGISGLSAWNRDRLLMDVAPPIMKPTNDFDEPRVRGTLPFTAKYSSQYDGQLMDN